MIKQGKSEFAENTAIKGLLIIERPVFKDKRGFFKEVVRWSDLNAHHINFKPIQVNHSRSNPGVIRGLHAENWNKLVYPVSGNMFSAIVDIRTNSPTFSKVMTFSFADDERKMLYIPKGLANSICVLGTEPLEYIYLVDAYYDGKDTRAVAWDDPDLNIKWPVKNPIISERDKNNSTMRELFPGKMK